MAVESNLTEITLPDGTLVVEEEAVVEIEEEGPITTEDGIVIQQTEDGGVLIDFDPSATGEAIGFYDNLALHMEDDALDHLGIDLVDKYESDKESRRDWEDGYVKGLNLLGLKIDERTEPFNGACGITHPLLSEAVVRFQSQTISEIFPASGPVRTKIVGKADSSVVKQSRRVQDYMNYLLTDVMKDYREEVDRMLFSLPLAGSAFKKVYWEADKAKPAAVFVPAEDLVVPYGATSLATAPRVTHVMRKDKNWVRKMQVAGVYRDIDLSLAASDMNEVQDKIDQLIGGSSSAIDDDRYTLLEIHVDLDLEGFEDESMGEETGIALPYVVTIDLGSSTVLSVYRNYLETDATRSRRDHFVHYQYIPGFGFYGFGLIHLIGGIAQGATSILRQLVDAGTFANLPGGFKSRGLRLKGENVPIAPGEWRDVDVPSGKIADNLMAMPYKEPSQVLLSLLGSIIEEGRRFASLTDMNISNVNQEAPVGTTLALLERNLKVMTAIQARIHASMRNELSILSGIIGSNYNEYPYELDDEDASIRRDFDGRVDVIPVSDPNSSTMAQRILQYQSALQLSQMQPQLYNHEALHRQMLEVLGIQDAENIVPIKEEEAIPTDPVTENQKILNLEPVKAFPFQDHSAHIQVHMNAMQDPKVQQVLEKSPTAQLSMAEAMSHITEHVAFMYRLEIQNELGVPLPPEDEQLPPEIEAELSRLVAEASSQLFSKNATEVSNTEVQKQLEDPAVMLRKRELDIREQEAAGRIQGQQQKMALDAYRISNKLDLDAQKLDQAREIAADKIRAQVFGDVLDAASNTENIESKEQMHMADIVQESLGKYVESLEKEMEMDAQQSQMMAEIIKELATLDRESLANIKSSMNENPPEETE
jgi:hypothetical protein